MIDGAIWNRAKSLADTSPVSPHKKAGLLRVERNERDRERAKVEDDQLDWPPPPGRIGYAGQEDEE